MHGSSLFSKVVVSASIWYFKLQISVLNIPWPKNCCNPTKNGRLETIHVLTWPLVHRFLRGSPPMRVDSTAYILTLNELMLTGRTAQVVVLFTQHMLGEARSEAFRTDAIPEEPGVVEDIELFEIALPPEPNNPPFSWGMEGIGWHHLVFLPRVFFWRRTVKRSSVGLRTCHFLLVAGFGLLVPANYTLVPMHRPPFPSDVSSNRPLIVDADYESQPRLAPLVGSCYGMRMQIQRRSSGTVTIDRETGTCASHYRLTRKPPQNTKPKKKKKHTRTVERENSHRSLAWTRSFRSRLRGLWWIASTVRLSPSQASR